MCSTCTSQGLYTQFVLCNILLRLRTGHLLISFRDTSLALQQSYNYGYSILSEATLKNMSKWIAWIHQGMIFTTNIIIKKTSVHISWDVLYMLCIMHADDQINSLWPYDDIGLGQHWLRQWLVAWWHQAITCTNVDLSSVRSIDYQYHLRAISQDIHHPCIDQVSLKITFLKFHSNLPEANEIRPDPGHQQA